MDHTLDTLASTERVRDHLEHLGFKNLPPELVRGVTDEVVRLILAGEAEADGPDAKEVAMTSADSFSNPVPEYSGSGRTIRLGHNLPSQPESTSISNVQVKYPGIRPSESVDTISSRRDSDDMEAFQPDLLKLETETTAQDTHNTYSLDGKRREGSHIPDSFLEVDENLMDVEDAATAIREARFDTEKHHYDSLSRSFAEADESDQSDVHSDVPKDSRTHHIELKIGGGITAQTGSIAADAERDIASLVDLQKNIATGAKDENRFIPFGDDITSQDDDSRNLFVDLQPSSGRRPSADFDGAFLKRKRVAKKKRTAILEKMSRPLTATGIPSTRKGRRQRSGMLGMRHMDNRNAIRAPVKSRAGHAVETSVKRGGKRPNTVSGKKCRKTKETTISKSTKRLNQLYKDIQSDLADFPEVQPSRPVKLRKLAPKLPTNGHLPATQVIGTRDLMGHPTLATRVVRRSDPVSSWAKYSNEWNRFGLKKSGDIPRSPPSKRT